MPTPDYRKSLLGLMQATLKETANWTYDATRPLSVPPSWKPGQKVLADCSKAVQFLCRWAGAPDPMGASYGPYGNSQTLWSHLQSLGSPSDLLVGDIVTFGPDGDDHATMVMVAGSNPTLWSFGHQGAPNTYLLSEDERESQYLRNPLPKYVPTKQDRLRAMTGWFAWVAWRLGEGDWKPYGRTDAAVRPSVPKLIPPTWWVRYARFILNRRKGDAPTTS